MRSRIDMTGKRIGRLVVLGLAPKSDWLTDQAHWHCACDCGVVVTVSGSALRRRVTVSCGCFSADYASERMFRLWKNRREAMRASRWERTV